MSVGSGVKPKTFADVRPQQAPRPLTANIKFTIQIQGPPVTVEAKFRTAESLADLYTFLEENVFESVQAFEIKQSYPQVVLPRDPGAPLASKKISGPVMLIVTVTPPVTLRPAIKSQ
jgi:hypothetical protein